MSDKMQRFTQRARRVLSLAQEEAERLNHSTIGTEHLLLGLMREVGGVASRALRELGVDIKQLKASVERRTHAKRRHPLSRIELSPETKRVLELTIEEARQLEEHYIGPEHLLLGLVRHNDGVTSAVLADLKVTPDQVRSQIYRMLKDSPSPPPPKNPFAPRPETRRREGTPSGDKAQRFTQRARRVLSLAQEEAERLNHSYIGTEHLLVGLMREEGGIASRVLREIGVDIKQVETLVERKTRSGQRAPFSKIDLSPGMKRVLELAIDEARRLGHHYIGTEHLLLALVSHNEGVAMDVLAALKITPDQVRKQTNRILQDSPSTPPRPPAAPRPATRVRSGYSPPKMKRKGQSLRRFTSDARHVMSLSEEMASKHKRASITAEYLFLGLVPVLDGAAGRVLRDLGVTAKKAESVVKRKSRAGKGKKSTKLELSAGTQQVIKLAAKFAREMNFPAVGTENLLMALVSLNVDSTMDVLKELKLTPDAIWQQTRLEIQASKAEPDKPVDKPTRQFTVICIDEDPALLDLVTQILTELGGEVFGAASVTEGLSLMEAHAPHLVVLNSQSKEGWAFYQRMKADALMATIPVVTMPGNSSKYHILLKRKIDEWMSKGEE